MRRMRIAKQRQPMIGRPQAIGLLCALLLALAPLAPASVNGNGAGLYFSTSDYWLGLSVPNGNGAAVLSVGAYDEGGALPDNGNGAALTINPLNIRLDAGSILQADFCGTPVTGAAPLEVHFTDLSTVSLHPIETWSWNFGDGGTSPDPNPIYTYDTPGIYTVSLTINTCCDVDGEIKTGYITVDSGVPAAGGLALVLLAGVLASAGGMILGRRR